MTTENKEINPNHTPPNEPTGIRTPENHPMDEKKWMLFIPLVVIIIAAIIIFAGKNYVTKQKENKFNAFLAEANVEAIVDYKSFESELFSSGFSVKKITIKADDNKTATIDLLKVNKYDKETGVLDAKIDGFYVPTNLKETLTKNPNMVIPPAIKALADQLGNEIVMDFHINTKAGPPNDEGMRDIIIHDMDMDIHNLLGIMASAEGTSKEPKTLKDLIKNKNEIKSLTIDIYDKGISDLVQTVIEDQIGKKQSKVQVDQFYLQMNKNFGSDKNQWPIQQQMIDQILQTLVLQNNDGFSLTIKPKADKTAYSGSNALNALEVRAIKTKNIKDLDI